MEKFGRLTQIFTTLKNYTKAAVKQNAEEHIPVMRPLFLMFENDTEAFNQVEISKSFSGNIFLFASSGL